MIGCESLPGDKKSQGAVIGGIGGALAGAAVAGSDDRGARRLVTGSSDEVYYTGDHYRSFVVVDVSG